MQLLKSEREGAQAEERAPAVPIHQMNNVISIALCQHKLAQDVHSTCLDPAYDARLIYLSVSFSDYYPLWTLSFVDLSTVIRSCCIIPSLSPLRIMAEKGPCSSAPHHVATVTTFTASATQ